MDGTERTRFSQATEVKDVQHANLHPRQRRALRIHRASDAAALACQPLPTFFFSSLFCFCRWLNEPSAVSKSRVASV